jgi:hypothetical protein
VGCSFEKLKENWCRENVMAKGKDKGKLSEVTRADPRAQFAMGKITLTLSEKNVKGRF